MEKKLKKQRNRLFIRVSLIMLAVWLAVTATYCAIRLYAEDSDVQTREFLSLSYAKQQLSNAIWRADSLGFVLIGNTNLLYSENQELDSQFIVTDSEKNEVVLDTTKKIGVEFGIKQGKENSVTSYGFIDYDIVRESLSKKDLKTISKYLNKNLGKNKHYELICTKFHILDYELFMPLELKIVLVNDDDMWFISDKIIKTFKLSENKIEGELVYHCNDMWRNIIPKKFLLNGDYNHDLIGSLTSQQRREASTIVPTGPFEYIFYASDYFNVNAAMLEQEYGDGYDWRAYATSYDIKYARKINLLDNCGSDLITAASVIFAFFFLIAIILCVMIWRTVRAQIIGEQKRAELTNALAHDIKTPLFVISGYAYTLKENINEDERDRYIDKIIDQTDEVNGLVHRMLSLSKLDSYTMTLNKSEFDISGLANEILTDYQNLPESKSITLTHSGDNTVTSDRELVTTALQNLIENAVKYSPPESDITIDITNRKLTIKNPSDPLTKAELKQLTQPFVRKDKSRHRKGNGLGLSIVKSILDLHGFKFEIKQLGGLFIFETVFSGK